MKYTIVSTLVAAALLLSGCGKNDLQKKLETELNGEITKMHDSGMATYTKAKDLLTQIDAANLKHEEMAKMFPKEFKDHSSADLMAAKDKIDAAVSSMDTWMKGFKPFDPEIAHDQVMTVLAKQKDELTSMNSLLMAAITEATTALDAHKQFAESLTAKKKK